MADLLAPGSIGVASIDHFEIDRSTAMMLGLRPGGYIRPGKYARLKIHNQTYMSDTDMEWRTNLQFLRCARGRVLVSGLGIGFVLLPALRKTEVVSLTVVEKSADVVALVEPQIRALLAPVDSAKLSIMVGDAYDWKPEEKGRQFDVIYHDIWADQSTDSLEDMKRLKRRYAPLLVVGGMQACWCEDELRARKRRERGEWWNR